MINEINRKIGELDLGVTAREFTWVHEKDGFFFYSCDNQLIIEKGISKFYVYINTGNFASNDNANILEKISNNHNRLTISDLVLDIIDCKIEKPQVYKLISKYCPDRTLFPDEIKLKIDGKWIYLNKDRRISGTDSYSLRNKLKQLLPSKKRWSCDVYDILDKHIEDKYENYELIRNGSKVHFSLSDNSVRFGPYMSSVEFRNGNKIVYRESSLTDKCYIVLIDIKDDKIIVTKYETIYMLGCKDNYAENGYSCIPGGYINLKHFLYGSI